MTDEFELVYIESAISDYWELRKACCKTPCPRAMQCDECDSAILAAVIDATLSR